MPLLGTFGAASARGFGRSISSGIALVVNYLIVAGGGGGGSGPGGGGGAGGFRTGNNLTVVSGTSYTVTVGGGGTGGGNGLQPGLKGNSGSDSAFSTVTSTGGGAGGGGNNTAPLSSGADGGSGGGGGTTGPGPGPGGSGNTPSFSPSQGNNGGTGNMGPTAPAGFRSGGGGGGASGVGGAGSPSLPSIGGNGGAGSASTISGTSVTYAGGGGGGAKNDGGSAGTGGSGGGSNGSVGNSTAPNATTNTGGGGGGGGNDPGPGSGNGGNGGSGIVIVSHLNTYGNATATGTYTLTNVGGYKRYAFTGSGTITFSSDVSNYAINKSLKFISDSTYLNRTPGGSGNTRTFTFSFWFKKTTNGTLQYIYDGGVWTGGAEAPISFDTSNRLQIYQWNGSAVDWQLVTTQTYSSTTTWYHIVCAVDTTQATAANRVRIYSNGTELTSFSSSSYPSLNFSTGFNNAVSNRIGRWANGTARYYSGLLTDFYFIDGQQLTPSAFGETRNSVWVPKRYTGTYGTNGWFLDFSNTSSLGKDYSVTSASDGGGNNNDWTSNGFTASEYGQTDVPSS